MDMLNRTFDQIDAKFDHHASIIDNKYVVAAITLFVFLYANLAAPKLPNEIVNMFKHKLFKLFICFLILYFSSRTATVAIVGTLIMVVILTILEKYENDIVKLDNDVSHDLHKGEKMLKKRYDDATKSIKNAYNSLTSNDTNGAVSHLKVAKSLHEQEMHGDNAMEHIRANAHVIAALSAIENDELNEALAHMTEACNEVDESAVVASMILHGEESNGIDGYDSTTQQGSAI